MTNDVPDEFPVVRTSTGETLKVVVVGSNGWTVEGDTVTYFAEDKNGREEWTEPFEGSAAQAAFPEWIWEIARAR